MGKKIKLKARKPDEQTASKKTYIIPMKSGDMLFRGTEEELKAYAKDTANKIIESEPVLQVISMKTIPKFFVKTKYTISEVKEQ